MTFHLGPYESVYIPWTTIAIPAVVLAVFILLFSVFRGQGSRK